MTLSAAELLSQLAAVVSGGPWLIVDLTNLTFIDCSSLAVLVDARERAQFAGGDVLLAGPCGTVARILLLTGQAGAFSVFPSVGVAAFSAGLAADGTRLAADGAGESLAAATEGMVMAAGAVTAPLVRDKEATADVPVACPMARSEAVCSGQSRTRRTGSELQML